jgi:hypothetical protein
VCQQKRQKINERPKDKKAKSRKQKPPLTVKKNTTPNEYDRMKCHVE